MRKWFLLLCLAFLFSSCDTGTTEIVAAEEETDDTFVNEDDLIIPGINGPLFPSPEYDEAVLPTLIEPAAPAAFDSSSYTGEMGSVSQAPSRAVTLDTAISNSDMAEILVYNAEYFASMIVDMTTGQSEGELIVPVGQYKALMIVGQSVDDRILLLGAAEVEEFSVTANEVTAIHFDLNAFSIETKVQNALMAEGHYYFMAEGDMIVSNLRPGLSSAEFEQGTETETLENYAAMDGTMWNVMLQKDLGSEVVNVKATYNGSEILLYDEDFSLNTVLNDLSQRDWCFFDHEDTNPAYYNALGEEGALQRETEVYHSAGNQFQKLYGGNRTDILYETVQGEDGFYYSVGYTASTDLGETPRANAIYLLKTDGIGNVVIQKIYDYNSNDIGFSLALTSDGIIIGGYTYSTDIEAHGSNVTNNTANAMVMKVDFDLQLQWVYRYGGNNSEVIRKILVDDEGIIFAAGYSNSTSGFGISKGNNDAFLLKLDSEGNELDAYRFGSSSSDLVYDLIEGYNGNLVLGGNTYNSGNKASIWEVTKDGDLIRSKNFTLGNSYTYCYGITKTQDGGYGITGYADNDLYIARMTSALDFEPGIPVIRRADYSYSYSSSWSSYRSSIRYWWKPNDIVEDPISGDLIAVGEYYYYNYSSSSNPTSYVRRDVAYIRVNKLTNNYFIRYFGNLSNNEWDMALSGNVTDDSGLIVSGYSESSRIGDSYSNGGYDGFLVKLSQNGTLY